MLGWKDEQSREFQAQAELAWHIWQGESDAAGRLTFWQNSLVALRTLLAEGEFFRIPLMIDRPGRTFSLALQSVDPLRVYTSMISPGRMTSRTGWSSAGMVSHKLTGRPPE